MFSYRHAFHAGNHADVLKHITLVQCIKLLQRKDIGLTLIDTHAGAAVYDLEDTFAQKSEEALEGILKLQSYCQENAGSIPEAVSDYLQEIVVLNPKNAQAIKTYPGSSQLMLQTMREQDKLRLMELHSTDYPILLENVEIFQTLSPRKKSVLVSQKDGFAQAKAYLPPPTRRGLCLIDPSYENKDDYRFVLSTLEDAIKRFATGVYLIWYPILQRADATALPHNLERFCKEHSLSYLQVELQIKSQILTEGLAASGIWIINPPWKLQEQLAQALPFLVQALGLDSYCRHEITAWEQSNA